MNSIQIEEVQNKIISSTYTNNKILNKDDIIKAICLLSFDDSKIDSLLEIDSALQKLGEVDPTLVKIVELRFFAGLSVEQTAEALNMSDRTVKRHWAYARAWLQRELEN